MENTTPQAREIRKQLDGSYYYVDIKLRDGRDFFVRFSIYRQDRAEEIRHASGKAVRRDSNLGKWLFAYALEAPSN